MSGTVRSRPNYYELLGLTPGAAGDAIAQAFARATSVVRPHPLGGITEICLAYQTLRDPMRRRAYDESLGLKPAPSGSSSLRPASARFAARPLVAAEPRLAPSITLKPRPDRLAELVEEPPVVRPIPQAEDRVARPGPVPRIAGDWSRRPEFEYPAAGIRPIEWKQTGAVIGGLVAAAVFVGAFAGWWSGRDAAEAEQPVGAAGTAVPAEEKLPSFSELWPEPAPAAVRTRVERRKPVPPRRVTEAKTRVERKSNPPQIAAPGKELPSIEPQPVAAESTAGDPLAPETAPIPAIAESMPLPRRTVARTIDRIGYSCGSVASATPVEGAAGVYRITCTSGQSFRAAPVNGRYRFRRTGRN